jgi:hypothetical protein
MPTFRVFHGFMGAIALIANTVPLMLLMIAQELIECEFQTIKGRTDQHTLRDLCDLFVPAAPHLIRG